MLFPYWIEGAEGLGVGVTAQSEGDAIKLVMDAFEDHREPLVVKRVRDASELDQSHVVPNMGNWLRRGIWYPLGYENVANY